MIKKIVSGGQTGADRAALDAAIKLGIPHGGWIPPGRKTEKGKLPLKYNLREMPTGGYTERTEQNVIDSDGTAILSHGRLSGGSEYTRKMAVRHDRPWIHIDLNLTTKFDAAVVLSKWVRNRRIGVLNIAGPRASHDPDIYNAVVGIVESVFFLMEIASNAPEKVQPAGRESKLPRTVGDAVTRLMVKLSLKDRTTIANMTEKELAALHITLGDYIRTGFGIGQDNEELIASCRFVLKKNTVSEQEATDIIIKTLWWELQGTHRLRIIK